MTMTVRAMTEREAGEARGARREVDNIQKSLLERTNVDSQLSQMGAPMALLAKIFAWPRLHGRSTKIDMSRKETHGVADQAQT